ncbi:MAG: DNA internalization-related competence protein ComEC/Rec2 [Bacillota bacterium]
MGFAAAYFGGIAVQAAFPMTNLIAILLFAALLLTSVCLLKIKKSAIWLLLLLIFYVGIFNSNIQSEYGGQLRTFWDQEVTLTGDVYNIEDHEKGVLALLVKEIEHDGRKFKVHEKIFLTVKNEGIHIKAYYGKRIRVSVTLLEPQHERNPKLFNYNRYLKTRGIYSIAYSSIGELSIIDEADISMSVRIVYNIREKMKVIIGHVMAEREGNLLLGILLGDKQAVDQETYQSFKKTGVAHVLAVSGLHVGIIYYSLEKLLKKVSAVKRMSMILLVLWMYVFVVGGSPSIVRAVSMVTILLLAPLFNRKYDPITALMLVAFFILVKNPLYLMDVGFQLSFAAVLSIFLLYKPLRKKLDTLPQTLAEVLSITLAAQLGTGPIIAYHFNYLPLVGALANIPVVFLVGYIVPIGMVTVLLSFINIYVAWIAAVMNEQLIKLMILLTELAEKLPLSSIVIISPSILFVIVYYSIIFIIAADKKIFKNYSYLKYRAIAYIISIYLCVMMLTIILPKNMKTVFLDVGQGDSTFIRTPSGKSVLIDGGGSDAHRISDFRPGRDIVVPFLLKHGVRQLDMVFLSHIHMDHMGGLLDIMETIKVKMLVIGTEQFDSEEWQALKALCKEKGVTIQKVRKGDQIRLEKDVALKILHPTEQCLTMTRDDINNNSMVMRLNYRDNSILFTGDIEGEAEKRLIESFKDEMDVNLLKVPHHGSRTSSTTEFVEYVKPEAAVIQVGKNNYGHPDADVIERLIKQGAKVYRNDKHGAVIAVMDGNEIRITITRMENERH